MDGSVCTCHLDVRMYVYRSLEHLSETRSLAWIIRYVCTWVHGAPIGKRYTRKQVSRTVTFAFIEDSAVKIQFLRSRRRRFRGVENFLEKKKLRTSPRERFLFVKLQQFQHLFMESVCSASCASELHWSTDHNEWQYYIIIT